MGFDNLQLMDSLLRAVRDEGYMEPTPIQEQAIPHVLVGRDLLGCAQTGTGKTAAFALPILQRLSARNHNGNGNGNGHGPRPVRALVLSPTRELATQIGESFHAYGRHTHLKVATIYGGVGQQPQVDKLQRGVDILVATPGRLLDLMQQGFVKLRDVEIFVLDEADRMLDMGFLPDVKRVIAALQKQRQTLMFSATMPPDIQKLADAILVDPIQVAVNPPATTVELTAQGVYFVEKNAKPALLQQVLSDPSVTRVLVFTRTKHGANKVVRQLGQAHIQAEPIHSNKSQTAREKALANFRAGRTRVLVATDIAARGIDVDNISHVINYDLPNEPETYVHRIGRTGRAGLTGIALSFCASDERPYLAAIEKLIRQRIEVVGDQRGVSAAQPTRAAGPKTPRPQGGDQRPAQRRRRGNGSHQRRDRQPPSQPKPATDRPGHGPHPAYSKPASGRRPAPAPARSNARRPRLTR